MKLKALPLALLALFSATTLVGCVEEETTETQTISLTEEGRYLSGTFDASAAEIVTFDETTTQTLVVNADSGKIDVLGSSDITNPILMSLSI